MTRTIRSSYNLPADIADARWYVVSPGGDACNATTTKRAAVELAAAYAADAGDPDYIVVDTKAAR